MHVQKLKGNVVGSMSHAYFSRYDFGCTELNGMVHLCSKRQKKKNKNSQIIVGKT